MKRLSTKELAKALKDARLKKGHNKQEAALEMGLSRQTVHSIETCATPNVGLRVLQAIAKYANTEFKI